MTKTLKTSLVFFLTIIFSGFAVGAEEITHTLTSIELLPDQDCEPSKRQKICTVIRYKTYDINRALYETRLSTPFYMDINSSNKEIKERSLQVQENYNLIAQQFRKNRDQFLRTNNSPSITLTKEFTPTPCFKEDEVSSDLYNDCTVRFDHVQFFISYAHMTDVRNNPELAKESIIENPIKDQGLTGPIGDQYFPSKKKGFGRLLRPIDRVQQNLVQ